MAFSKVVVERKKGGNEELAFLFKKRKRVRESSVSRPILLRIAGLKGGHAAKGEAGISCLLRRR